jgi:hypothetical protein
MVGTPSSAAKSKILHNLCARNVRAYRLAYLGRDMVRAAGRSEYRGRERSFVERCRVDGVPTQQTVGPQERSCWCGIVIGQVGGMGRSSADNSTPFKIIPRSLTGIMAGF